MFELKLAFFSKDEWNHHDLSQIDSNQFWSLELTFLPITILFLETGHGEWEMNLSEEPRTLDSQMLVKHKLSML